MDVARTRWRQPEGGNLRLVRSITLSFTRVAIAAPFAVLLFRRGVGVARRMGVRATCMRLRLAERRTTVAAGAFQAQRLRGLEA